MGALFIGIDLAWGEKNLSGFCVLQKSKDSQKLRIIELQLLKSLEEIIEAIQKYNSFNTYLGIDAPLVIPNQTGNRDIEKDFIKDFAQYKISMLPVNRNIMTKYSQTIRSEILFEKLEALGFKRDMDHTKSVFEVYTHSTMAVCFNDYKILPYKRKKGRSTEFIKEQLAIYKNYLLDVIDADDSLIEDISSIKGQALKSYEDKLDSILCAYAMYYCLDNPHKFYKLDGVDTFLTPI